MSIAMGGSEASLRYRPTGAYDVDPTLGSTATPGFAEYAGFYSSYRVVSSKAKFAFTQNGSSPLVAISVPLNADPGAAPVFATIAAWASNPYQKHKAIPPVGAPTSVLISTMSTEKIYGSKMVYFDDNFSSPVNTVPVNNWWWAIGIICSPVAAVATNINTVIDIDMDVEFFDRRVLTS